MIELSHGGTTEERRTQMTSDELERREEERRLLKISKELPYWARRIPTVVEMCVADPEYHKAVMEHYAGDWEERKRLLQKAIEYQDKNRKPEKRKKRARKQISSMSSDELKSEGFLR